MPSFDFGSEGTGILQNFSKMKYELLGLSLEDIADRHPIKYPPRLDGILS